MTLNQRHKAILFVTLVFTGCALLVGVELKEALGYMMLGVASAWAIGSDAASKLYSGIKEASGTFYSWIRLPLAMALAGGLLGAALLFSRANPVAVVALMCAAGIVLAPLTKFPTRRIWLRIPLILLSGSAFFLAVWGMISTDLDASIRYGEIFGHLAAIGSVTLLVGIFWLSKGWKLIQDRVSAPSSAETTMLAVPTKRARGQYISLSLGVAVLTVWLSIPAWFASSVWSYAPEKVTMTKDNNNLLVQVTFIVLLAWWPFASWKRILAREPNSEPKYLRRHRRTSAIAGMIFVVVLSLAVTYGIQNGNDVRMNQNITASTTEMNSLATKIGTIKQRDLRTADDYIQAYAEIEALLPEYESEIQKLSDVYQEARRMNEKRAFINIQFFYKDYTPDMWKNAYAMLDLIREADSLTRRETLTIQNMAALPVSDQVAFWQKEFQPFIAQENELREKMQRLAGKFRSSTK